MFVSQDGKGMDLVSGQEARRLMESGDGIQEMKQTSAGHQENLTTAESVCRCLGTTVCLMMPGAPIVMSMYVKRNFRNLTAN